MSTFSSELRIELIGDGERSSTWGAQTNTNIELLEDAIAGMATISTTGGTTTLTTVNGATDQARFAILKITGALVSGCIIEVPAVTKQYLLWNATSGTYTVQVKTSAGTGVYVAQGSSAFVFCDATNVYAADRAAMDSTFVIFDEADPTKIVQFQLSGVTTGTTRTLTVPDASTTLVGADTTQVLSGKTLTLPQINDTSSDHQYVFAVNELAADRTVTLPLLTGNDEFVFKDHTATLTNKTINLTSNTLSGTTAQFNTALSDGDFTTLAGSETLTNKTINLTSNTLSGTTAQFNTALSDGDFTTLAGSESLSNKTLTTGNTITGEVTNSNTAAFQVSSGTTAQRPTNGSGKLRYNSDYARFEGNNGSSWTGLGGASGAGGDSIFWENGQTVTTDYTIAATNNAGTFGPVTINGGVTVTVSSGAVWTVV